MATDSHNHHHYIAAGALADPRVMDALLGGLPSSHQMELQGFALGLVSGSDVNASLRTDVFDPEYRTRVLVPNRATSVMARLYTGLTDEQLTAVRMFTYEGVITREGTDSIGGDNEAVGEAKIHVIKDLLDYEELSPAERDIFPNGFDSTIEAALETRRRIEKQYHGPSPERR